MTKSKIGKNKLPLLAVTALILCFSLIIQNQVSFNVKNTQQVLSKNDEGDELEFKNEDKENKTEAKVESGSKTKGERSGSRVKETEKPKVKLEPIEIEDTVDEVETDDDFQEIESEDSVVSNRFKLKTTIDSETEDVEVETDPESLVNEMVEAGEIDNPVLLEAKTNKNDKVDFEIQGTDSKKFLGLFDIVIPKTLTVSSETGEVVSKNQNIWSRILNLLSI